MMEWRCEWLGERPDYVTYCGCPATHIRYWDKTSKPALLLCSEHADEWSTIKIDSGRGRLAPLILIAPGSEQHIEWECINHKYTRTDWLPGGMHGQPGNEHRWMVVHDRNEDGDWEVRFNAFGPVLQCACGTYKGGGHALVVADIDMPVTINSIREVTDAWLSGNMDSPIVRQDHDDNWECRKCGEMYEHCECAVPRLND